jgi:hypothetical protein
MSPYDFNWHDSQILEVLLKPEKNILLLKLLYPTSYENGGVFEERIASFKDYCAYQEHEGLFFGSPSILNLSVHHDSESELSIWRFDTNAGYRQFKCREFSLEPHNPTCLIHEK